MNKYPAAIKFGVLAGIIMVIILLLIYFVSVSHLTGFWPLLCYVPLIFLMVWGGVTIRRENGSFKGYGQAFLTVLIISVTATMLFDTFGYVLYKVIDPDLPAIIKAKSIENTQAMMEKFGAPDDKIDETIKKMQDTDFTPTIKGQLIRYASSIVIGVIFSLIIGAFVNRSEEQAPVKETV